MNKDAILASIIGFGIGLMITGAILVGPSILPMLKKIHFNFNTSSAKSSTTKIIPSPGSKTSVTDDQTFTIDMPADEAIVNNTPLTVSGKVIKGATVVVDSTEDESVIIASESSSYQTQVELKEGKNDISVTSLGSSNNTTKHITVYYTPKS